MNIVNLFVKFILMSSSDVNNKNVAKGPTISKKSMMFYMLLINPQRVCSDIDVFAYQEV